MKNKFSRLGFGLSSIAGSGDFRHQERLIKTAIDSGITHFDVAPYYGSGDAETILGKILKTCPDTVTVTTKFGLLPPGGGLGGSLLRKALRPVFRKMKSLKSVASSIVKKTHQPKIQTFTKGSLIASIETSLKKIDRPIDVFLLHDILPEMATNSDLLNELEQAKQDGKTSFTGISGEFENVLQVVKEHPESFQVAQFENSLKKQANIPQLANLSGMIITHRAIQGGLTELEYMMKARPKFIQVWNREIGLPLANRENLANLLIALALYENNSGTVLFSTVNAARIEKVSKVLISPELCDEICLKVREIFSEIYINNNGDTEGA